MNHSTAIFLINDRVRAIGVSYDARKEGDNAYDKIIKTMDSSIKVGDYVVVPTNERHKMTVCRVAQVDLDIDFDSTVHLDWIIGTIDLTDFDEIERQEAQAVATIKSAEKRRKREELRVTLINDTGEALKALPVFTGHDEPSPVAPPEGPEIV